LKGKIVGAWLKNEFDPNDGPKHQIEAIYIYIDNRIQMHFDFPSLPVVEIREDSRAHKRLGPTRL
jgi:hypothetical protein